MSFANDHMPSVSSPFLPVSHADPWPESHWQFPDTSYHDAMQSPYQQYSPSNFPMKIEPEPDYSSLIRALAPYASKALSSSFAAPERPYAGWSPAGSSSGSPQTPDGALADTPYQLLNYMAQLTDEGVENFSGSSMYSQSSLSSPASSRHNSPNPGDASSARRLPCLHPGCTRTFKREYTRSVHMTTHEVRERQRFKCQVPHCQEEFSRRHDRFRHEVHIHGVESEWKCHTCGKFFAKEITLVKHACAGQKPEFR